MKRIINEEGGFTLIELLVVILIIGILIAVAAPSFLGQVGKAHDSSAKQRLALAYKAAKASSIDRAVQGNWTDTPDAFVNADSSPGADGRPDPFAGPGAESAGQAPAGEFDEDELVMAILNSEPGMGNSLVDGGSVPFSQDPDDDALAILPASGEDAMFVAVTCTPGDCDSGQILHLYALSDSGKVWKVEVPANGAIGAFDEIYTP